MKFTKKDLKKEMKLKSFLIKGNKIVRLNKKVVILLCPKGHSNKIDFSEFPKAKRLTGQTLDLLIDHWKSEGVAVKCKKCSKQKNK